METLIIISFIITSILSVTFMIERGIVLRWDKVLPQPVVNMVQAYQSARDLARLQIICDQNPSPISRLLLFASDHLDWPKNENAEVVETRARHECSKLDRGLVVLEIVVGIAPLLGLMGTILGLIHLFASMKDPTMVNQAEFARGISDALWFTFSGLFIAIPTLVGWSYYTKKVENLSVEMESLCEEFLRKHYRAEESDSTPQIATAKMR